VEHGHHALLNLNWFRKLGGYQSDVGEDPEFDRRLIKSGGKIWLADDIVITYFPRKNTFSLFRQYVRHGRGRTRVFIRHGGRRVRHCILASVAPMVLLGFLAPLYWPLALPALGWLFTCLSYGVVLGVKERDICALASGYASIVMQVAWSIGHWREIMSIRTQALVRPS
jgi:succinoglycan biosynthesis protein ExoA